MLMASLVSEPLEWAMNLSRPMGMLEYRNACDAVRNYEYLKSAILNAYFIR